MHADSRSINLLHISAALLQSQLYAAHDKKRTWLLDYYLQLRQLKVHGSTPLKELFPTLPENLKILLAEILLLTPYPKLGFFGEPDPQFISDLHAISTAPKKKNRRFKHFLAALKARSYCQPVLKHRPKSTATLLRRAEKELVGHQAFASNKSALTLAVVTKSLFGLISKTIPDFHAKAPYHLNVIKNAFLTAEMSIPHDLLEEIRQSYTTVFKDFVPLAVFYSLGYQTTLGARYVPNLASLGSFLGFMGTDAERFSYIKRYRHLLGHVVSKTYDLRYDRVCRIVPHGANTSYSFDVHDGKVVYQNVDHLPKMSNPYDCGYIKEGLQTEEVLGKSEGTWIIDHNSVHYNQKIKDHEHRFTFPFEVRFLTPRSRLTASLNNSAFTRKKFQIRAFTQVVSVNPITKPDLTKRPEIKDRRWHPLFDEYLRSNMDLKSLVPLLLKDEVFFKRLQPKLSKLTKKFKDRPFNTLTAADFKDLKIYYEGYEGFELDLPGPIKLDDEDERLSYALYKACLKSWLREFQNPALPGKVSLTLRTVKANQKSRTVCRAPILLSIFESFANRLFQVIFQKINRDVLDYSVSNYLPGLAVPLYTMERFRDALGGEDFALCNLDVKSCFDNINLKHPNFLKRLELGLAVVDKEVSPAAAGFLRYVLKDYLYDNLVLRQNFSFKKSKSKTQATRAPLPADGTLPTGFVLSPALWLVLALPALMATQEQIAKGNLKAFDLCGDDFMALAPRGVSEETKAEICQPWFELADDLGLSFHFFKNFKDRRVYFNPKWDSLFSGRESQEYQSAWIDRFPAYSIPLFHAGTVLAHKSFVETTTGWTESQLQAKLSSAFNKRKRERTANFLPASVMEAIRECEPLASRFGDAIAPKRPRDRGEAATERERFLTGAQGYAGALFAQEQREPYTRRYLSTGGTEDPLSSSIKGEKSGSEKVVN